MYFSFININPSMPRTEMEVKRQSNYKAWCSTQLKRMWRESEWIIHVVTSCCEHIFVHCNHAQIKTIPIHVTLLFNLKLTLTEFAMTPTVYLWPSCVRSAYVTSVLFTSFNVLARVTTGNAYCGRWRNSRHHLSCSMCACTGTIYMGKPS